MLGIVSEDENHNKTFKPMAGVTLGQGVPLGAWCSFEKDVAPSSNWLMAGTTFDASVYPALNLYLGTNVVPSRYDHNRPSDYESITLSTDSNNPTVMEYDAVYVLSFQGTADTAWKGVQVSVNGKFVGFEGGEYNSGTQTIPLKKGDSVYLVKSGTFNQWHEKIIYYKHPLFIKATSIASDSDQQAILAQIQEYNTYSTEETLTGKTWIDGKPIYRKCGNTEQSGVWPEGGDYSLNLSWFKQSVIGNVTITKMEYHQGGKSGIDMRVATITVNGVSFYYPYQSGLGYSPNDIIVFEYTKTND